MKFKLKTASLIVVIGMAFGVGTIFMNESNAQGKTYRIGDRGPAGGWIFYDKENNSDGWRYLEVAPEDQGDAEWGCMGKSIQGTQGTAVGTGKANTKAIIKGCKRSKIAAKKCTAYRGGGKSDWFLPSKDELYLIYVNLHQTGIGGFVDDGYWSSSEKDANFAWYQYFHNGNQEYYTKGDGNEYNVCNNRVRAVRYF